MSTFGKWHCVHVSADGIEVYHPHSCPWSITYRPRQVDTDGNVLNEAGMDQRHECDVSFELTEYGHDACSVPTEPGFYWLQLEHIVEPSGPWGPAEYDTESVWRPVTRPRFIIEQEQP